MAYQKVQITKNTFKIVKVNPKNVVKKGGKKK